MPVFIHNTIFVIQNGVKRNEESIENQCGSSFVGMTKLLYFQTFDKLRTFKEINQFMLYSELRTCICSGLPSTIILEFDAKVSSASGFTI